MKKLLFLFILLVSGLTFSQTKNISETKGSNNQQSRIEDPLIDDPNEGDPIELEPEGDPITTLSPSIETSEVGNTNGELSVSGTGGAVYNIPIALPPGINNVAPNISLNYSSQSGDGCVGYGWNIGGISRISRVPSTLYHDGIIDPVDFDNYDRFTLDGQRLILKSGTYGNTGSTYETENFSNLKISFLANGFQTYFKVEYPDGSIALYGYSNETSSMLSFSEWPITQWKNPQNLSINYKYYNYNNELHIKSIDFGTNTNTGINKIEFTYKTKNKETIYYIDSIEYRKNKVLSSIKVTGNGVAYRNYYLTHDLTSTGYERLKSIQEKTGDNTKSLKPITFSYKVNQSSFSQQLNYNNSGNKFYYDSLDTLLGQGDFDGDGEIEFLTKLSNNNFRRYKTDENCNIILLSQQTILPYNMEIVGAVSVLNENLSLSNKNSLGIWHGTEYVSGEWNYFFNVYKFNFSTNSFELDYKKRVLRLFRHYEGDPTQTWENLRDNGLNKNYSFTGDFNGDKSTDLLNITYRNGVINTQIVDLDRRLPVDSYYQAGIINTGNTSYNFSPNTYNGNLTVTGTSEIKVGDYDGDGKLDLYILRGAPYNKIEIYTLVNNVFSLITSFNYNLPGEIGDKFKKTDHTQGVVKYRFYVNDFNGDGKSDIFLPYLGKILIIENGYFKEELLPNSFVKPASPYLETYHIGDVNSDGKLDLVIIKPILESESTIGYPLIQVGTNITTGNAVYQAIPVSGYNYNYGLSIKLFEQNRFGTSVSWQVYDLSRMFKREFGGVDTDLTDDNEFNKDRLPLFIREKENYPYKNEFGIMGGDKVAYFNFFRHMNDQTLLTRVDQGNGIVHEITYNNLMNGNGTYTTSTSQETYPYYNLLNGKENKVVSEIKQISSFTKKKLYKYHGAIFDLSGRGINGFQATTVTNWFNDPLTIISTVNKFDFTKNGAIKETFSKVGLIEPNYTLLPSDTFIARSINTYNHEDTGYVNPLLGNKIFKLFKTKTENFNGQNNTSSLTTVNYNSYNNPINSTTVIKNGGTVEKTTANTFGYDSVLTSPYIVDRLNNKVNTTTLAATGDAHSSEEQYVYDINLLKQNKKRSTNSGLTSDFITENNEYDVYGNVIQKKYSAPGMADRVVNYEYDDATHRFLVKKVDPELQQTVYTYNQSTGLLLTETLPSIAGFPLKTTYSYDLWGKLVSVKDYLNNTLFYSYSNISGSQGILKTIMAPDGSISKTIYDPFGRILYEGSKNLNEQWSVKSTLYNIYDQPLKVYKNYLDGNTPEVWDELQYDVYGRLTQANHLKSISSAGKTVTYTYNGLTTTENDGLKIKTTINNASGQVISLNDNPGETITYDYFANGNLKKAYLNGGVLEIQQDAFGRRKTLIDPSAGTRNYEYNKFGELTKEEVVGKGETEFDLDSNGKLLQKRIKELGVLKSRDTYTYNSNKQLASNLFEDLANSTQINYTYTYDNYKRLLLNSEDAAQYYFKQELRYDAFGRTEKQLYHAKNKADNKISDKWIKYEYKFGNKYKVYDMINESTQGIVLWEAKNVDKDGNVILGNLNNGALKVEKTFDIYGFPTQSKYSKGLVNLATLDTEFDPIYGNLTKRTSNLFGSTWTENLSYDALDRLTTWKDHEGIQNQSYNDNGTIDTNKIGDYAYTISNKPFQVSTVTPVVPSAIFDYYANREQNITYNVNKKPLTIKELTAENIDFEYNGFDSRSVMYYGGLQPLKADRPFRKYYSADGSMEIKRNVTPGGAVEFYTYIGGSPYSSSIVLKSNGTTKEYLYLLKDYQETINAIVNQSGTVIEKRQFDVWGTLIQYANASGITTIPTTANGLLLDRGYTSHEHLLGVNIINMNGRVYDHHLHKFLQPDNNIQDFYNTQNYNRYGYVMNNPTKYTDESGELWGGWGYIIGALFNAYSNGYQSSGEYNPFKWDNIAWTNAGLGAASFAASAGATYYADNYITNYGNNNVVVDDEVNNSNNYNDLGVNSNVQSISNNENEIYFNGVKNEDFNIFSSFDGANNLISSSFTITGKAIPLNNYMNALGQNKFIYNYNGTQKLWSMNFHGGRTNISSSLLNNAKIETKVLGNVGYGLKYGGAALTIFSFVSNETQYRNGYINENQLLKGRLDNVMGIAFPIAAIGIVPGNYLGEKYHEEITDQITNQNSIIVNVTTYILNFFGFPASREQQKNGF